MASNSSTTITAFSELLSAKNDLRCLLLKREFSNNTVPTNSVIRETAMDASPVVYTRVGINQAK